MALILALLLATTATPQAAAEGKVTVGTARLDPPPGSPGAARTPAMRGVVDSIGAHDLAAAHSAITPIVAACEAAEKNSASRLVSFANAGEFAAYSVGAMQDPPPRKNLLWKLDDCALAYKMEGFLRVEANDPAGALRYVDLAIQRAPYWASPLTERGFLLSQAGDHDGALAAYTRAIELADQFPSSAYIKPMALVGVGFLRARAGQLELARKAYEECLRIDRGNAAATQGLRYLDEAAQPKSSP